MLATLKEVCELAKSKNAAVGSFNTPNTESLWAVIDAAEKLNVPVIIAHAQCHDYAAPLDKIAPLMVAAAKNAKVPVCVHLDHGEDFDYCKRAIAHGFTSVMIDYSTLPYEENVKARRKSRSTPMRAAWKWRQSWGRSLPARTARGRRPQTLPRSIRNPNSCPIS